MKSFKEHQARDRRLAILQLLREAGNTTNVQILNTALEEYGHLVGRDVVLGDIAWLVEQDLVHVDDDLADVLVVVKIRQSGLDVADGRSRNPGVARPRPV